MPQHVLLMTIKKLQPVFVKVSVIQLVAKLSLFALKGLYGVTPPKKNGKQTSSKPLRPL